MPLSKSLNLKLLHGGYEYRSVGFFVWVNEVYLWKLLPRIRYTGSAHTQTNVIWLDEGVSHIGKRQFQHFWVNILVYDDWMEWEIDQWIGKDLKLLVYPWSKPHLWSRCFWKSVTDNQEENNCCNNQRGYRNLYVWVGHEYTTVSDVSTMKSRTVSKKGFWVQGCRVSVFRVVIIRIMKAYIVFVAYNMPPVFFSLYSYEC